MDTLLVALARLVDLAVVRRRSDPSIPVALVHLPKAVLPEGKDRRRATKGLRHRRLLGIPRQEMLGRTSAERVDGLKVVAH